MYFHDHSITGKIFNDSQHIFLVTKPLYSKTYSDGVIAYISFISQNFGVV